MFIKVKDIPPKILIMNGNRKQWLQNHPDFGAFFNYRKRGGLKNGSINKRKNPS